ncbi:hypothetical protein IWQ60_007942 [Tieghemiomyces parasiticus]|uniref:CHY-type domain-containing protein n=1 Tax=Tieghemiomyces parasiticus TaxID=78921 RepID=A0A9W7ZUL3_9FUNG|nr:hypothetical protein IWQ60_007942 [Tieghemiomyces parasiticus]
MASSEPKPSQAPTTTRLRPPPPCHFFAKGFCRAGDQCAFRHVPPSESSTSTTVAAEPHSSRSRQRPRQRRPRRSGNETQVRNPKLAQARTAAPPPLPSIGHLVDELKAHPVWKTDVDTPDTTAGTACVSVAFPPSDPEFPFDIAYLHIQFALAVASDPTITQTEGEKGATGLPQLVGVIVRNPNVPTGVRINIEQFVLRNAAAHPDPLSLRVLVEHLDKHLEALMKKDPAPVVRFINHRGTAEPAAPPSVATASSRNSVSKPARTRPGPSIAARAPVTRPPVAAPRRPAADRRTMELGQLERRLRPAYWPLTQSMDDPFRVAADFAATDPDFPFRQRGLHLIFSIPQAYPAVPAELELEPLEPDAAFQPMRLAAAGRAFTDHMRQYPHKSLVQVLNWLDRELGTLLTVDPLAMAFDGLALGSASNNAADVHGLGGHSGPGTVPASAGQLFRSPSRRGIHIQAVHTELLSADLIFCSQLSLQVTCARCRTSNSFTNIAPTYERPSTGVKTAPPTSTSGVATEFVYDHPRWTRCPSCQQGLGARFRPDYIHSGSFSVGFLDTEGCEPLDLLPSSFHAVCSHCNHEAVPPREAAASVRSIGPVTDTRPATPTDDTGTNTVPASPPAQGSSAQPLSAVTPASLVNFPCPQCHQRIKFNVQGIRFLRISPGWPLATPEKYQGTVAKANRVTKEKLGIVPGQPLPTKGACKHYRKSFRWFRFPCCGKVYPCDNCHDDVEDHESELARRIICGLCSREQSFQPGNVCVHCAGSTVKRQDGRPFWEGGEGMRDRTKMSRRDPHKYRGLTKTVAKKG